MNIKMHSIVKMKKLKIRFVLVKINGSELYSYVPLDKGNSHYKEMMEMVDAKTLTIKDAE